MKLRLNKALFLAVTAACALHTAYAKTLDLYILTGQSNSLGAVKGTPASPELLAQYASGGLLWNGNMAKDSGNGHDPSPSWKIVAPQLPTYNGNNCMGPEYGFDSVMLRKGWGIQEEGDNVGVIKASLDGGGNSYWVKGSNAYNSIVQTVKNALDAAMAEDSGYEKVNLAGLLYLQGESDGAAEIRVAQERYDAFLSNLKEDLQAAGYDTTHFTQSVMGECATWNGRDTSVTLADGSTTTSVLEQKALADSRDDIGWVRTRDLTKITSGDTMGVHYDGKSEITIGARYAYAMALQKGYEVGHVRGDNGEVSLDSAEAWWDGAVTADEVAVWDVSSANVEETLAGDLTLKGIRIEDTFRTQTVIGNASGADATLSIGSGGIEVQQGRSLALQTNLATTSAQTWSAAADSGLVIGTSGASVALAGNDTVTLQRAGESGQASFEIYASSSEARTWEAGDGVELCLVSSQDVWASNALSVLESASATLSALGDSVLSLASLTLGDHAVFDMGGSSTLNLTLGSLDFGTDTTLKFNLESTTRHDKLSLTGNGTMAGTVNFEINVSGGVSASRQYVLFENWTGGDSFTYTTTGAADATLALVDGNLVFSLASSVTADYSKPDWSEGAISAVISQEGEFYVSSVGENNTVFDGKSISGNIYFFANGPNGHDGAVYTELRNTSTNWVAGFGSGSGSRMTTVSGETCVKVTGEEEMSFNAVYLGVNGALHDGNVYIELDAENATYGSVNGLHNASADGSLTLVIRSGTVNGEVVGGSVNGANSIGEGAFIQVDGGTLERRILGGSKADNAVINGGVSLLINGGTFKAMVAGGNDADGSEINGGISLTINGGVFKDYVIGAGFRGSVNGDIELTISGGDFSAMNDTKGIYAGGGSSYTNFTGNTTIVLRDVDDSNEFASYTGVISGKNQTGSSFDGTSSLVLDNYTASRLVHQLTDMDSVSVGGGSDTGIAQTKGLGGATSVEIQQDSVLRLIAETDDAWDLSAASVTVDGTLELSGTSSALGAVTGSGTLRVAQGELANAELSSFRGVLETHSGTEATVSAGNAEVSYSVGQDSVLNLAVEAGAQGTLDGSGRVVLTGNGTNTTAFAMAEGWKGTVVLTDKVVGNSGNNIVLDFNSYGHAGSTIEMNGLGYQPGGLSYISGSATFDADFHLTPNADGVGLFLNAGSSNAWYVFTGTWSGEGDFCFEPAAVYNVTSTFHFKGDMTAYSGDYTLSCAATLKFGYGDTGAGAGSISGTGQISGTDTGSKTAHLIYDYTSNVTAENLITGNVDFTKEGYADLTLTAANTYTGATRINDGTLVLSGEGSTGTGEVIIAANAGVRTERFSLSNEEGATATVAATEGGLSASSAAVASLTLSGGAHVLSGTVQTETLTNNGTLILANADVQLRATAENHSFNVGSLRIDDGFSQVTAQNGAALSLKDVSVSSGASLALAGDSGAATDPPAVKVTITAQSEEATAEITEGLTFNSGDGVALSGQGMISRAKVEFSGTQEQKVDSGVNLNACSIVNSGEGLVSIQVAQGASYELLQAKENSGGITILGASAPVVVSELNLAAGQTVSVFSVDASPVMPTSDVEATLQLTTLTNTGDSTLNANLVLGDESQSAYTLNLKGTVYMGSSLSVFSGGELNADLAAVTGTQVLFSGVDELSFNGEAIAEDASVNADSVFSNLSADSLISFVQAEDGTWSVVYTLVPEPTTATLSLLALAALAARRRRKSV